MVVFSNEKEEDSVKKYFGNRRKNFAIRGLTAEKTNCQISQNRARFCTFKIALSPSESLVDLK